MKVTVDLTVCQDHGQCMYAAPHVFHIDESGKLNFRQLPVVDGHFAVVEFDGDAADCEAVVDAADVCPLQAITIED